MQIKTQKRDLRSKILYFSFVEFDIPNACQTHTLGVLCGFSSNSCKVDAIVPRPKKVRPKIPGVHFYYLWPWRFSPMGRRWFKFLSSLVMIFLCMRNKYGFIYVREMEANPGPRLCSKLFHIPLYMEINDLIVPVQSEDGYSSHLIYKVKRNQELDFEHSAGLIIPSVPMRDWIINGYSLPASKVHMILNGTEVPNINKMDQALAREKLGLPLTCFCLGFVGNMHDRFDFNSTLNAFILCQDKIPNLRLAFVGNGPKANELRKKVNELGLERKIVFTGFVQPGELVRIVPAFDIGLMLPTKKATERYGPLSTKFSTYAIYQLQIIASGYSLEGYPDELSQGLFLVPPDDPYALADMILWLYNHPEEREQRANILHDFVIKKLTWNAVTKEILDIVKHDKKMKWRA